MTNQTAMQYFEWYLPSDGQHWNNLAEDAQHLADLGISHVWMPPAFKATNKDDVGYGVYDLFDLGEFDQKGTVRTKYGLKEEYLNAINQLKEVGIVPMADVPLHNNLHKASLDGADYDLTTIFDHSLVKNHPEHAVTFVDNHDTQRGQALESTVEEWFKPAAYALILLREDGLPCLFYGDYYGIEGEFAQENFQEILDTLLYARKELAYGEQTDYFDDPNCIGWTRSGNEDGSPLAVTISNDAANSKSMEIGSDWAGQTFYDILGNCSDTVTIDKDGWGDFPVSEKSVSVWTIQD